MKCFRRNYFFPLIASASVSYTHLYVGAQTEQRNTLTQLISSHQAVQSSSTQIIKQCRRNLTVASGKIFGRPKTLK